MSWARLDDRYHSHIKTVTLTLAARGLWVTMLSWAAGQSSNGFLPAALVRKEAGAAAKRLTKELVDARCWHPTEDGKGWLIHDFAVYMTTPRQKQENQQNNADGTPLSQTRSEAGRKGGKARWDKRGDLQNGDGKSYSKTDSKSHETDSKTYGNAIAKNHAPVPEPVPVSVASYDATTSTPPPGENSEMDGVDSTSGGGGQTFGLPGGGGHFESEAQGNETIPPDLDSLNAAELLNVFRQKHPDSEDELALVLSQATTPPRSQAAYLRPHLLRRLRGEEPAPVVTNSGERYEHDRRSIATLAARTPDGDGHFPGLDDADHRYPTAAEIADGKYADPYALIPCGRDGVLATASG